MNIDHAKTIPLREILTLLNCKPKRTSKHKLWYLSPLRNEKTASFVVNTQCNNWYDFGEGVGGDVVNFVCYYLKSTREAHTVVDALRWLRNMTGDNFPDHCLIRSTDLITSQPVLELRKSQPIENPGLIQYLHDRNIELDIATKHLKQVQLYNANSKKFFVALGLPNELNGMELRNPYFKGSFKKKSFSFIRGREPTCQTVHVFEGMMDYLSVATIHHQSNLKGDTIILNSVSCLQPALAYVQNYPYRTVCSWMDNDQAGSSATDQLQKLCANDLQIQHYKMNGIYAPYNDVNEWHVSRRNNPAL